MTGPVDSTPQPGSTPIDGADEPAIRPVRPPIWDLVPKYIRGTRIRTSTAFLVLVFVACGYVYLHLRPPPAPYPPPQAYVATYTAPIEPTYTPERRYPESESMTATSTPESESESSSSERRRESESSGVNGPQSSGESASPLASTSGQPGSETNGVSTTKTPVRVNPTGAGSRWALPGIGAPATTVPAQ